MSKSHFDSMIDYFIAIDKGEIENVVCIGYGIKKHPREPRKRIYTVGEKLYSHVCPLCGIGSAGGISEESYQKWIDYKEYVSG